MLTAGDETFEADNVVVATGVMQKPHVPSFARSSIPGSPSSTRTTTATSPSCRTGRARRGREPLGVGHRVRGGREHHTILSGVDTGQIPARVDTRRGRMGFRALFFVGSHILTADTPPGRKMREHVRHGGAPLLRYRRKELLAAGVERTLAEPSAWRTAGRCSTTAAFSTSERRLVHRVPARLLVDRRSVRHGRRRLPRPVPRRRRLRSGALFRRTALPAFVHVDADRGTGRDAERVARHIASQAASGRTVAPGRSSDPRAGRVVSTSRESNRTTNGSRRARSSSGTGW